MTPTELRSARKQLGNLSQRQLGEMLDCSQHTIRKWETGERGIPGPVGVLVRMLLEQRQAKMDGQD